MTSAMIVEADLGARELLARVARRAGFEVLCAVAALQARQAMGEAASDPVELLLLDLDVEDSAELLRELQLMPEQRRPRHVLALGEDPAGQAIGGLQMPGVQRLSKPLRAEALAAVLSSLQRAGRSG